MARDARTMKAPSLMAVWRILFRLRNGNTGFELWERELGYDRLIERDAINRFGFRFMRVEYVRMGRLEDIG